MRKQPITKAGQECRHCQTPVKRCEHKPGWKPKAGRIWYLWWFKCPKCRAIYMNEDAKQTDQLLPREFKISRGVEIESTEHDHFQRLGQWANNLYEIHNRNLAPIATPF